MGHIKGVLFSAYIVFIYKVSIIVTTEGTVLTNSSLDTAAVLRTIMEISRSEYYDVEDALEIIHRLLGNDSKKIYPYGFDNIQPVVCNDTFKGHLGKYSQRTLFSLFPYDCTDCYVTSLCYQESYL